MHRVIGVCTLVLCSCLVAGCGSSHARLAGVPTHITPAWLTKIVRHEATLLGNRSVRTVSITFGKHKDVIDMFGEFKTPAPAPCTTGYCPVPVRMHGTSLRLVVSPRSHRLLSAALGARVAHIQAVEIAQRSSPFFHIFRPLPARVNCSIPRGAQGKVYFRGRCTTEYASSPPYHRERLRIGFIERWHEGHRVHQGGWIVTVGLDNGRVLGMHLIGKIPPQLWM